MSTMSPPFNFSPKHRRAIITGGAQGIGLEFAKRLLREGAKVVICDIDATKGEEAAEQLRKDFKIGKDSIHFTICDVTSKDNWAKMWDEAEEVLGGKIEILCNNAGVPPRAGMDTNLAVMTIGATTGVTYATERMSRSKGGIGGRIITTASGAGLIKVDFGPIDSAGYSMSKHGNVVLTRMFPHFKPAPADDGVKAYALCPFYIPTRMVLEEPSFGNKEGTEKEEATRNATQEIFKRSKSRMLTMDEVSDMLAHTLKKDVDGACYFVYPDLPIIETPDPGPPLILSLMAVGKVGNALGKDSLTAKEVGIILFCLLYVGFYLLHHILMIILSIIF